MVKQAADGIDRPGPGHYQGRLAAVLSRQSVTLPIRDVQTAAQARRRVRVPPRPTRRVAQLAFPLELR